MPFDASDASHHSLTGLEQKSSYEDLAMHRVLTFHPFSFAFSIHTAIMNDDYGEDSDYGESEMGGEVGQCGGRCRCYDSL
jgi:hypothetical protein